MPQLKKILISDYRNIAFQELTFSPNLNCISGNNGEGKTNLLDAVYYLSMTKSAFSSSDKYNFRHGREEFAIGGTFNMENGLEARFSVNVSASGEKKVRRDEKVYPKISDHIGILPVVIVSPSDTSLVSDSGEERRRFVNSVLSQLDREYLHSLQQYNRLLIQRNAMLKGFSPDPGLIAVLDEQMAAAAEPVRGARKRLAEDIRSVVGKYYMSLSGGREEVDIEYKSDLDKAPLTDLLKSSLERDRIMKYTTVGPQRDDFIFKMNGDPIRKCGSQGQQKSFLVSLKFSQYEIMKNSCGFPPTLLLDDVFDKLDMNRVTNLLSMVSSNDFGQIFITDTNKVRMEAMVDSITEDRAYFEAKSGTFERL